MKNIILFAVCMFFALTATAQQDVQYSQFFSNKLAYNPAYAGANEHLTVSAIYRNQWQGVEGAPTTMSVFAHTPFMNDRAGMGLSLTSDRIGKVRSTLANISYAYRIPMGENGNLSFGLSTRLENNVIDWTQSIHLDVDDVTIPMGMESSNRINFGTGIYYTNDKFFAGLSAPTLLKSGLYKDETTTDLYDRQSYYVTTGGMLPISDKVTFAPSIMLSINPNAPFEADINASLIFLKSFLVGASYRVGDSVDGIIQYQITNQIKLGIAADYTLTELKDYTTGSWEVLLEYQFKYDNEGVNHIRFL